MSLETGVKIKLDMTGVDEAKTKLSDLSNASTNTHKSVTNLERAMGSLGGGSAQKAMSGLSDGFNKASSSSGNLTSALRNVSSSLKDTQSTITTTKTALQGLAGAFAVNKVMGFVDSWNVAAGQVRVATSSISESNVVLEELYQVSMRSRAPLGEMVDLFQNVQRASKDLGISQKDAIQMTESIGKAMAISGKSAADVRGALLQLTQALGSGNVRAQEFNSVMMGFPYLMQKAAENIDGTNGSVQRLRKMMLDGALSSKEFAEAILNANSQIEKDFAKKSVTFSQAFVLLSNALTKFLGETDAIIGTSQTFGKAIIAITDNFGLLVKSISVLIGMRLTAYFADKVRAISDSIAAQKAANAETANSIRMAQAEATANLVQAESKQLALRATLEQIAVAKTKLVGDLDNTKAVIANTTAEIDRLKTLSQVTNVNAAIIKSENQLTAALAKQQQIKSAHMALLGKEMATKQALNVANANVVAQTNSVSEAMNRTTTASFLLTKATNGLKSAFAMLGGVWGIAIGAIMAAVYAYQAHQEEVRNTTGAISDLSISVDEAIAKFEKLDVVQQQAALRGTVEDIRDAKEAYTNLANSIGTYEHSQLNNAFTLVIVTDAHEAFLKTLDKMREVAKSGGGSKELAVENYKLIETYKQLYPTSTNFIKSLESQHKALADAAEKVEKLGGRLEEAKKRTKSLTQAELELAVARSTYGGLSDEQFDEYLSKSREKLRYAGLTNAQIAEEKALISGANQEQAKIAGGIVEQAELQDELAKAYEKNNASAIDGINARIAAIITERAELEANQAAAIAYLAALGSVAKVEAMKTADPAAYAKVESQAQASKEKAYQETKAKVVDQAIADLEKLNQKIKQAQGTRKVAGVGGGGRKKKAGGGRKRDTLESELDSLLKKIDPVTFAEKDLTKAEDTLTKALEKGKITREQYNSFIVRTKDHFADLIDPYSKVIEEGQRELDLLKLSSEERKIESDLYSKTQALKKAGIDVTKEQTDAIRSQIVELEKARELDSAKQSIYDASEVKRLEEIRLKLEAINALKGKVSPADTLSSVIAINPELFKGTDLYVKNEMDKFSKMYADLAILREQYDISEATANQMRLQIQEQEKQRFLELSYEVAELKMQMGSGDWVDASLVHFQRYSDGFTNMMDGVNNAFSDMNMKFLDGFADSIGRAIVYSEDLGASLKNVATSAVSELISALVKMGIQWVATQLGMQATSTAATTASMIEGMIAGKALLAAYAPAAAAASLATSGGNASGATAGVSSFGTVLNTVLATAGKFATGGYIQGAGTGKSDSILAKLSNGEFVSTAKATKRYGPVLKAMNSNDNLGLGNNVQMNVSVENYTSGANVEVEQLSETDVRIIVREEVAKQTDGAVASALSNTNSKTSKALSRTTMTQRKRN